MTPSLEGIEIFGLFNTDYCWNLPKSWEITPKIFTLRQNQIEFSIWRGVLFNHRDKRWGDAAKNGAKSFGGVSDRIFSIWKKLLNRWNLFYKVIKKNFWKNSKFFSFFQIHRIPPVKLEKIEKKIFEFFENFFW